MVTATVELARAAGEDAANAHMQAAGRTTWSREDYNHGVRTFNRVKPTPRKPHRKLPDWYTGNVSADIVMLIAAFGAEQAEKIASELRWSYGKQSKARTYFTTMQGEIQRIKWEQEQAARKAEQKAESRLERVGCILETMLASETLPGDVKPLLRAILPAFTNESVSLADLLTAFGAYDLSFNASELLEAAVKMEDANAQEAYGKQEYSAMNRASERAAQINAVYDAMTY